MSELAPNPLLRLGVVHDLLRRHSLQADKSFGQNFLIDSNVLAAIVEACGLGAESNVVEVGPGLGVLTFELAQRAKQVTSIELDQRLFPVLEETLADFTGNINIIHADGLDYDFSSVATGSHFAANLPYNVATAIIGRVLASQKFKVLVFLVQREVAERLAAKPSTKSFGALSLTTQYFAEVKVVRHVKATAFMPPPKVESSVVQLRPKADVVPNPELFEFIYTGFKHRRKTLKKNLLMANFDKTAVASAMETVGIEAMARAESLKLADFEALHQLLRPHSG